MTAAVIRTVGSGPYRTTEATSPPTVERVRAITSVASERARALSEVACDGIVRRTRRRADRAIDRVAARGKSSCKVRVGRWWQPMAARARALFELAAAFRSCGFEVRTLMHQFDEYLVDAPCAGSFDNDTRFVFRPTLLLRW